MEERRKLLLTMLDAVYVDAKEEKSIVAIKTKPPFRPIFEVALTKEESGVVLLKGPPDESPEAPLCFWWRRGRVELPVQKNLLKIYYKLSRLFVSPGQHLPTDSGQASRMFLSCPYRRRNNSTPTFRRPSPTHRGEVGVNGSCMLSSY